MIGMIVLSAYSDGNTFAFTQVKFAIRVMEYLYVVLWLRTSSPTGPLVNVRMTSTVCLCVWMCVSFLQFGALITRVMFYKLSSMAYRQSHLHEALIEGEAKEKQNQSKSSPSLLLQSFHPAGVFWDGYSCTFGKWNYVKSRACSTALYNVIMWVCVWHILYVQYMDVGVGYVRVYLSIGTSCSWSGRCVC